jgi:tetratricopeptide (TPR) repeat protein
MKKWVLTLFLLAGSVSLIAQSADDIIKSAREFTMKGDFENSIMVLKNGLEKFPDNAEIRQELALAYYSIQRNPQALEALKPLLDNPRADETVFQVAGLIYRSSQLPKEAEKIYKSGLKLYPKSGMLHNEYGQLMEIIEPGRGEGIKLWEKGIELDPGFAGNYFHAARYYSMTNNSVWALMYGEMFVNLDSYSNRTIEVKNMLFQFYKKIFAFGFSGLNNKNTFEKVVSDCLFKQKSIGIAGITPESLSAIRARFILDWFSTAESKKYPFRLFERHQQMLREGIFDAYNQWLFGGAANMAVFQNWTKAHSEEYQAFTKFQRQQLFVVNAGQYYKM